MFPTISAAGGRITTYPICSKPLLGAVLAVQCMEALEFCATACTPQQVRTEVYALQKEKFAAYRGMYMVPIMPVEAENNIMQASRQPGVPGSLPCRQLSYLFFAASRSD